MEFKLHTRGQTDWGCCSAGYAEPELMPWKAYLCIWQTENLLDCLFVYSANGMTNEVISAELMFLDDG